MNYHTHNMKKMLTLALALMLATAGFAQKFGYCTKLLILLYNISDTKYTNHDSLAAIKEKNLSKRSLIIFSFTAQ